MKKLLITITILMLLFAGCSGMMDTLKPYDVLQAGSEVIIPVSGATEGITGTIVDTDSDGIIDGIDLDGTSSTVEIPLAATSVPELYSVDLDGDGTIDFYLAVTNGAAVMNSGVDLAGNAVAATASGGSVTGFDTTGDGSADLSLGSGGDTGAVSSSIVASSLNTNNIDIYDFEIDASGNHYIAASLVSDGTGLPSIDLGNNIAYTGTYTSTSMTNAFIVKYSSDGAAKWVMDVDIDTITDSAVSFNDIAFDSSGNLWVVGSLGERGDYDFGNGVTLTTALDGTPFLIKINELGEAQSVISPTLSSTYTWFNSLVINDSDDKYILGRNNSEVDFGNSVSIESREGFLVKYNSAGIAQWVKGATRVSYDSLSLDSSGNVYAAGKYRTAVADDLGDGVSLSIVSYIGELPAIIKYSPAGVTQWANVPSVSATASIYVTAIGVDSSDNIYLSLDNYNNYTPANDIDFGGGQIISLTSSSDYAVVKYNTSGTVTAVSSILSVYGSNTIIFDSEDNFYLHGQDETDAAKSALKKFNTDLTEATTESFTGTGVQASFHILARDSSCNLFAVATYKSTDEVTIGFGGVEFSAQGYGMFIIPASLE